MNGEQVAPNLYKRGDYYHVRIMLDGRSYWRSTGRTTLKAALARADEIKVALRNGDDDERERDVPTFTQWTRLYEEIYSAKKADPTRDHYVIEPAMPYLGAKRLDEITKSTCQAYLNRRGKEVSDGTLNNEQSILQAIFERALEDGLIEKNPWKGIGKRDVGPRIRILTEESEGKLRVELSPRFDRWLTWMLETGLRIAESCGTGKDEVDFDRHLLHVTSEVGKGGKERWVPLSDEVEAAIRLQLTEYDKLWHGGQDWYRELLETGCKKAGIGHISPHDLRHTFATRYLKNGGDIFILSKILGHASVTITEKTYVHLQPEDLVGPRRAVNVSAATRFATTGAQPKSASSNVPTLTLSENIEKV